VYRVNMTARTACVRDSGSPGASGVGCAASGGSKEILSTAAAGNFNLYIAAPGAGYNGAVTVTATPPTWLLYQWNAGSSSNSPAAGQATFGIFPGSPARIYQREVY
jgi:MSHA biogenesis protein MshQ